MKPYYIDNLPEKREKLLKSTAAEPFLSALISDADMAVNAPCTISL